MVPDGAACGFLRRFLSHLQGRLGVYGRLPRPPTAGVFLWPGGARSALDSFFVGARGHTNNVAELSAMLFALRWVQTRAPPNSTVIPITYRTPSGVVRMPPPTSP